jgi:glucokinase
LGRFAGDLALIFQETGGVFLAGGIAPRIVNLLDGKFRQGFEDKSPFAKLMSTIPTFVITRPDPAIVGLLAMARKPDRFAVLQRPWRDGTLLLPPD